MMRASLFEVVVEPHRRVILDALRERDHSVGDLVDLLRLAQPTVSKHLKALREAGLVTVRPEAQRRWYQLRTEPLRELDDWLEPYRRAWSGRLDDLGRHLDEQAAREGTAEATVRQMPDRRPEAEDPEAKDPEAENLQTEHSEIEHSETEDPEPRIPDRRARTDEPRPTSPGRADVRPYESTER